MSDERQNAETGVNEQLVPESGGVYRCWYSNSTDCAAQEEALDSEAASVVYEMAFCLAVAANNRAIAILSGNGPSEMDCATASNFVDIFLKLAPYAALADNVVRGDDDGDDEPSEGVE